MNDTALLINHFEQLPWESRSPDPERSDVIRWKHFRAGDGEGLSGLSAGLLEIPRGGGLRLHHHEPAEIYYVVSGTGTVHIEGRRAPVRSGSFALIPAGAAHKIVNEGDDALRFIWMFPASSWHDVSYDYLE